MSQRGMRMIPETRKGHCSSTKSGTMLSRSKQRDEASLFECRQYNTCSNR
jgi:hypothetical protein